MGTVPLASVMVFDAGVYLVVFGSTMLILSMMGTLKPSKRILAHRGVIDPTRRSIHTGETI